MAEEVIRTVKNVRNPKWLNAEHSLILCEVEFEELIDDGYIGFTANPNDVHPWCKTLYDSCVAGTYGAVEEFDTAAATAAAEAEAAAKATDDAARQASLDKWKALGLTEDDLENLTQQIVPGL